MKAVGYTRVSTSDQAREGVSLDLQETRIRAYCALMNLELVAMVREEGVSGSVPLQERPGGQRMGALLEEHGATHVLSLKLDRLFRDAADALTQTRAWDEAGIALHLVDMGGQPVNTGSAMGRMVLTMMAGFAELERNLIAERTSAALQHKKAQGQHVSRPPFGFRMVNRQLVPVPEELTVVQEVKRQRAAGKTLWAIAHWLREQNVPTRQRGTWRHTQVRQLLTNRLYVQ